MSDFLSFAKSELTRAGYFSEDSDYGGLLGPAVMKMMEQFNEEGHSGLSARIAVSLFTRLAKWEPLTPLTGEDDEWNEVGDGKFQNRRCPTVFKDAQRGAYNSDGKVFRKPSGVCFTISDSRVPITFPYVPKTEYVDIPERA